MGRQSITSKHEIMNELLSHCVTALSSPQYPYSQVSVGAGLSTKQPLCSWVSIVSQFVPGGGSLVAEQD